MLWKGTDPAWVRVVTEDREGRPNMTGLSEAWVRRALAWRGPLWFRFGCRVVLAESDPAPELVFIRSLEVDA